MSCYKALAQENEELRLQLLHAQQDIERLKEALAMEADWLSPEEVIQQLSGIDLHRYTH